MASMVIPIMPPANLHTLLKESIENFGENCDIGKYEWTFIAKVPTVNSEITACQMKKASMLADTNASATAPP